MIHRASLLLCSTRPPACSPGRTRSMLAQWSPKRQHARGGHTSRATGVQPGGPGRVQATADAGIRFPEVAFAARSMAHHDVCPPFQITPLVRPGLFGAGRLGVRVLLRHKFRLPLGFCTVLSEARFCVLETESRQTPDRAISGPDRGIIRPSQHVLYTGHYRDDR